MKPRDVLKIAQDVENEGFDQAFVDYSDYADIQDADFHQRRRDYLEARNSLAEYLGMDNEVQKIT